MKTRLKELTDCYRHGDNEVTEMIDLFEARVDELEAIIRAGFLVTCGDVTYATFGYPCMSSQHNTTIIEICKPSPDVPTAAKEK